jgi:UDP-N-acetylglucosamine enolpyruvyl transferase
MGHDLTFTIESNYYVFPDIRAGISLLIAALSARD